MVGSGEGAVQLKNVRPTVDVMNIIVTIIFGVKCAQNASNCAIFKEKIQKIFWRGAKLTRSSADAEGPHDAFCHSRSLVFMPFDICRPYMISY